jgi:MFS family permease
MNTKQRLFWASFITLIAAGLGFAVRAGILGDWREQFGFTMTELGQITGGGLVGFGLIIVIASVFAEKLGYGRLMALAFLMHFLSAIITLAATPVFAAWGRDATYWCLFIGMFMFAIGNGICEAVINPLAATLYPKEKTHWLNILHAGWPGGLILGGLIAFFWAGNVRWEILMSLFLIPVLVYGLMMFKQRFPISEARASGATLVTMLKEFAAPVLLFLLLLHAMIGYVELGTDSWIGKITGSIMEDPAKGMLLFVYTSGLMFVLRFFAGPIVHHISPLGLLLVSSILGAIGLAMLGGATTVMACVVAATIYGLGKTFLWPTMLGVVSERYPRGGALTLGAVGGIGMLSAGLLGGPGIGFKQDVAASNYLEARSPATLEQYADADEKRFLFFTTRGLDGSKVAELVAKEDPTPAEQAERALVTAAELEGGRKALTWTALIPLTMAVGYLLLIIYFKATGGYKQIHLEDEEKTGGVQAPHHA